MINAAEIPRRLSYRTLSASLTASLYTGFNILSLNFRKTVENPKPLHYNKNNHLFTLGGNMDRFFTVDICGRKTDLPIMRLPSGIAICFFNLHGNQSLTEHCGAELAKRIKDCDIVITAESKGLQLAHVVARELGQTYYAVCRKSKKLYMQDGLQTSVQSITTGEIQTLYLSKHDADLLKGKRVAVVDDVVSTGGSLKGIEEIVRLAGGEVVQKAFVLAEGDAAKRSDVLYLASIPIIGE